MSFVIGMFTAFFIYAIIYVYIDSLAWEEWSIGKLRGGYSGVDGDVGSETNMSEAAMFMNINE